MKLNKNILIILLICAGLLNSSFNKVTPKLFKLSKTKTSFIEERLEKNKKINSKFSIENQVYKEFKIDSIFRNLSHCNKFNGCILVAQHGQILYKNSFGTANPLLDEPLKPSSIFQLASVSKTITGVSVLTLIEQEKIGLDDYLSLYFPDFPYPNVTIRHLLSHMSGIPDYIKLDSKFYPQDVKYYNNQDAYNAIVNAHLPSNFTPGSRFKYNNSNYALLALLVEKISGESFPDYVENKIFLPLGMKNSSIAYPDQIWSKENRTFGLYNNNQIYPNDKFDGVFGDKGAYSTIEDMFQFDRALYPDVLLSKSTLELAFTNNVFENNRKKQYGLGFRLREDNNNQKIIFHNGWWHGYRTAFHRREQDNSCVIILSNRLNNVVYSKAKELFNVLDNNYMSESAEDEDE